MGRKNSRGEGKDLSNLARDKLYARDVPPAVEAMVEEGIATALQKMNKHAVARPLAKLTGTSALRPRSEATYEIHYRGLTKFFKLIGDYESLLMLRDKCPENCPSMKVESLVLYCWWKFHKKGSPLTDLSGAAVKDVLNNPLTCRGDWNDPDKRKSFGTAVWNIHKAHKQTGTYVALCEACRRLPQAEWFKGCDTHKGHPAILRSGNPSYDSIFTDCMDKIKQDRMGYKRSPSEQLLPSYVRKLRDRLISSNSLIDLQTFTIIVVSISLFLRFDDFVDIEISHFEPKLFVFDDMGNIRALCLKVFGKSDSTWTHLMLWRDEEYPELCPVSALLCYIHCAQIKGGFLFPTEDELIKTRPPNGIFVTQLDYEVGVDRLKKAVKTVLKLKDYKVGMHTFRRTAYLFGRWGGGDIVELAKSARHISHKTAELYIDDADALLQIQSIHNDHTNKVRKFVSVAISTTTNALQLNLPSLPFQCEVPELASRFVHEFLRVPTIHPNAFSSTYLCGLAMEYVRPDNSTEDLAEFMEELPVHKQRRLATLIDAIVEKRVLAVVSSNRESIQRPSPSPPQVAPLGNSGLPAGVNTVGTTEGSNIPQSGKRKRKKRKCGPLEFKDLALIGLSTDPVEKLDLIVKAAEFMKPFLAVKGGTTEVTDRMRVFDNRFVHPIMTCLNSHCNGSKEQFLSRHINFKHTKFAKGCGCKL